jgi:hypothetical protein
MIVGALGCCSFILLEVCLITDCLSTMEHLPCLACRDDFVFLELSARMMAKRVQNGGRINIRAKELIFYRSLGDS